MIAGYGTLLEVKRDWDLDALCDAHEILDVQEALNRKVKAEAQRGRER